MDLDKTPYKSGLTEFFSKFAHNTQLVIPVYQRNYTWTAAGQVEPFLNDIENVINGKFKTHFMGIIIYNVTKMSAINGNEYSIIDGQQRITTAIIMLYAIRDLLMESGLESAATKIEHVYLSNRELDDEMKIKKWMLSYAVDRAPKKLDTQFLYVKDDVIISPEQIIEISELYSYKNNPINRQG